MLPNLQSTSLEIGDVFFMHYHYTYDAVGNRLTQDTSVSGMPASTSYGYDDANRLMDVNGMTYTWDNNGNLLNDGVNTYT